MCVFGSAAANVACIGGLVQMPILFYKSVAFCRQFERVILLLLGSGYR